MPQPPAPPRESWLRAELRPTPAEVEPLAWVVWAYERRPANDFERCREEVEIHLWAARCVEKSEPPVAHSAPAAVKK